MFYYGNVKPVEAKLTNQFDLSQKQCNHILDHGQYVSFKLSEFPNHLYKVNSKAVRLYYNTLEGEQVLEPTVYLNLSNDKKARTVFPLQTEDLSNKGLPKTSTIQDSSFKCHSSEYLNNKLFAYKFSFGSDEEKQGLSIKWNMTHYGVQTDLASDTCVSSVEFKDSLDNEVVLNKQILDQFCHEINYEEKTLKIANYNVES